MKGQRKAVSLAPYDMYSRPSCMFTNVYEPTRMLSRLEILFVLSEEIRSCGFLRTMISHLNVRGMVTEFAAGFIA